MYVRHVALNLLVTCVVDTFVWLCLAWRNALQHYLENIRAHGTVFSRQEIADIFSNIETIHQFNSRFVTALQQALVSMNIGNEVVCKVFTTMVCVLLLLLLPPPPIDPPTWLADTCHLPRVR
jgi:hypothetical protein